MSGGRCAGHAGLADELREYATGALDLLEPWLDRVREQRPDPDDAEPASCAVCPVCAVITVLRGGRSDLAVRVAEHAAGLVTVLRAAIDEGVGATGSTAERAGQGRVRASVGAGDGASVGAGDAGSVGADPANNGAEARTVQRISVSRDDECPPPGRC